MLFLQRLLAPRYFYRWSGQLLPWLVLATVLLFAYGLYGGLYVAPPDYQQGDAFRIIYIHVPSAFLSLLIYIAMALAAAVGWIWRIKLADWLVVESAPLGASFAALTLITGAIWGKPTWGTWWIWDARLTSELILFFLYCGYIALRQAIPDGEAARKASNILLFVGVIDIPIIHFSVYWWYTLHQGATLSLTGPSHIAPAMLHPLLAMIAAFLCYSVLVVSLRVRKVIAAAYQKTEKIFP